MNANSHRAKSTPTAFSLIEVLIVLGIVGLLLAFAAPNLFSLIGSSSLTGEGTLLENQLTLAQQQAISRSADVEVRFYKFADQSSAQTEDAFRAFQLFQFNPEGELIPISSFFRIRPPTAVHERLSTLLDASSRLGSAKDRQYGFVSPREGVGEAPSGDGGALKSTPYVAFRFRPDGSTDLPFRAGNTRDTWYITLVQGEGALASTSPDNYVCLQVNPYNGQVIQYRP